MICEVCGHTSPKNSEKCLVCGYAFVDRLYGDRSSDSNIEASFKDREITFAFPFLRIISHIIDSTFVGIISVIISTIAILAGLGINYDSIHVRLGTIALVSLIYGTYYDSSIGQASPGKKILKMYVGGRNGDRIGYLRAFIRNFLKVTMIILPYVRFIDFPVAFVTKNKQSIHDIISDSYVFYR